MILCGNRNSRDKNCLDFLDLSCTSFIGYFIYFLSCILDHYDHYAGNLLLFREKKMYTGICSGRYRVEKIKVRSDESSQGIREKR